MQHLKILLVRLMVLKKAPLLIVSAYNGTTTGAWSVKHSDLNDNKFIGSGSNKDGDFTVAAEAADNTASGAVKGVNKYGLAWKGEFKATIEGNKYNSTSTGSVSSGCKFTSEIARLQKIEPHFPNPSYKRNLLKSARRSQ